MEVTECKTNVKCDLGVCRNRADYSVMFDRVASLRHRMHLCEKCLNELHDALGKVVAPHKAIETAKPKKAKK